MRKIRLGCSDLEVPPVAVGFWRLNRNTDVRTAEEFIRTAMENGGNFFDHADIYGKGEAEKIFAEAVHMSPAVREKMIIQTKCGIVPGVKFDFSRDYIISAVEGSLKRLNTDYIDVLLLHRPDTFMEPEEVCEAFDSLKSSGKVRYFGVSNENVWQMEYLRRNLNVPIVANQMQLSIAHCPMIQSGLNVNMFNESAVERGSGIIEYCRMNNITIQTWSPFQHGFGAGTFIDNPDYKELNDKLEEIAEAHGVSKTTVVMSWNISHPAKMQGITGTLKKERVAECLKAADLTLTREEWYAIYMSAGNILP
ncbi:MAG: aldo/keto reductase [Clostridiales bacterium]|nr:aldo/keto reductase [Clostridiales bacterium]MCD7827750.1 aldo/keto reductase [Clostridiales bacterium]